MATIADDSLRKAMWPARRTGVVQTVFVALSFVAVLVLLLGAMCQFAISGAAAAHGTGAMAGQSTPHHHDTLAHERSETVCCDSVVSSDLAFDNTATMLTERVLGEVAFLTPTWRVVVLRDLYRIVLSLVAPPDSRTFYARSARIRR